MADQLTRRQRLAEAVGALARIDRRTTRAGERQSAEWLAKRLASIGAAEIELRPFRGPSTWAWANIAHGLAGVLAAIIGSWRGQLLALVALASYEADYTARNQWLRRFLPSSQGTSAVARLPARGEQRQTLVLVAHHDAAHGGWIWHPRALAFGRAVARRTGSTPSYAGPAVASLLLVASGSRKGRRAGGALLSAGIAVALQASRSPTAPGANDNATGVAAVLELTRELVRTRPAGLEVLLVFPGGEEVGLAGMRAWVRESAGRLDPESTLVLGLDALGAGKPVVVKRESFSASYSAEDLSLVDQGADWASLPRPARVGLAVNTDPMAARHAGLPSVSILSMHRGGLGHFHTQHDVAENVDWQSVEDCLDLAQGVIGVWAQH